MVQYNHTLSIWNHKNLGELDTPDALGLNIFPIFYDDKHFTDFIEHFKILNFTFLTANLLLFFLSIH